MLILELFPFCTGFHFLRSNVHGLKVTNSVLSKVLILSFPSICPSSLASHGPSVIVSANLSEDMHAFMRISKSFSFLS